MYTICRLSDVQNLLGANSLLLYSIIHVGAQNNRIVPIGAQLVMNWHSRSEVQFAGARARDFCAMPRGSCTPRVSWAPLTGIFAEAGSGPESSHRTLLPECGKAPRREAVGL